VIAGKYIQKEWEPIFYGPFMSPHLRSGYHTGSYVSLTRHLSKGGKLWRIRGRHMDVTWIRGPTREQIDSKTYVHQESTQGPTWRSMCRRWRRVRVGPQGVLLNRPFVGSSQPSTWRFLVSPRLYFGGAFDVPLWPSPSINRRGPPHF
jgi:hypothetical protein